MASEVQIINRFKFPAMCEVGRMEPFTTATVSESWFYRKAKPRADIFMLVSEWAELVLGGDLAKLRAECRRAGLSVEGDVRDLQRRLLDGRAEYDRDRLAKASETESEKGGDPVSTEGADEPSGEAEVDTAETDEQGDTEAAEAGSENELRERLKAMPYDKLLDLAIDVREDHGDVAFVKDSEKYPNRQTDTLIRYVEDKLA